MVNGDSSAVLRHVRALFGAGAAGGMSDGQLLDRFRKRRGEPDAEAAFAVLVARHGPMVFGVCSRAPARPQRCGRRVPGHLPGPGPQGRLGAGRRLARPLALRCQPPRRRQGQSRAGSPRRSRGDGPEA